MDRPAVHMHDNHFLVRHSRVLPGQKSGLASDELAGENAMTEKEIDIDKLVRLKEAGYRFFDYWPQGFLFISPSGDSSLVFCSLGELIEALDSSIKEQS